MRMYDEEVLPPASDGPGAIVWDNCDIKPSVSVGHTKSQLADIAAMVVTVPDPAKKAPPLASESAFMPIEKVTLGMIIGGLPGEQSPGTLKHFMNTGCRAPGHVQT